MSFKVHFNQSLSMILWNCPHDQRCCSRSIFCPPQKPFLHKPSTHSAPSNTPHSIAVLLRKKKLEIWCPTLEEPLGDFPMSLGNFYPAHKYQRVELCSTAASLPDSSRQGWQLPAGKTNPLPGTCSQLTAAAAVLRKICPSTASTNLCTFAGVTNLLQMTSGKAKALPWKCVSDTT